VLIDWFTVAAQVVNFLILLFLLKHFLYDRILRAMDQREEKIRLRLQEAAEKRKEAEEEAASYHRKKDEIETERGEILFGARERAEQERKELARKARREVEGLRSDWQESLQKQKETFLRDLRRVTAGQVYAISRRALSDLAGADLEEAVVGAFLSRLDELPPDRIEKIVEAFQNGGNTFVIRSGFEISPDMRRRLERHLKRVFADGIETDFEQDPDLIMGLELKSPGEKIAWSLEEYLNTLEERARQALEKEDHGQERVRRPGSADTNDKRQPPGAEPLGDEHG
jgi:F-type H+-transporting ATPase subunit b